MLRQHSTMLHSSESTKPLSPEYEQVARLLLSALANKWRLRVLHHLTRGPRRLSELMQDLDAGLSEAALAEHLLILQRRGLVHKNRASNAVQYTLTMPDLYASVSAFVSELARSHSQIENTWRKRRPPRRARADEACLTRSPISNPSRRLPTRRR
jgi:DNA-binding HxlR family transcriptional regulator